MAKKSSGRTKKADSQQKTKKKKPAAKSTKKEPKERFVVERRINLSPNDELFLDKKFLLGDRIYNIAVKFCNRMLKCLWKDAWYKELLEVWSDTDDEKEQKRITGEIFDCAEYYGLSEPGIHAYLGKGKNRSFDKGMNIDIVQKIGSELYASVKKSIFTGKTIRYRKYGQTNSLSAKKANGGIIYKEKTGVVCFMKREYKLKPVRKGDAWLMEALRHEVKYCRIIRRPYKGKYRYFLQLVMDGVSPKKVIRGNSTCGIDPGPSVYTWVTDEGVHFEELAPDVRKYENAILYWGTVYDRRRRMANPDCYNEDGTIKKGSKFVNHTKGTKEAVMKLKSAYQKKKAYVRQSHGHLTNNMVRECKKIAL